MARPRTDIDRNISHTSKLRRSIGYVDLARHARKLRKSTDEAVRGRARTHLAARMGKLRGLPQKIGQILSMSSDAEAAEVFAPLTGDAEPLPFDEIQPLLEQAWGTPLERVVRSIEPHGLAASLGQVHRAVLHDGRSVR